MITFRPLAAADFPLLTSWLAQPHVRRFVQKSPMTLEDVAAKYGPRVQGEQPIICHVARSDGADFGYLQAYLNRDWPDAADGETEGISVDLYIGEPAFLRRGLGRAMLDAYVRSLALPHFAQTTAYIAHELANTAALACSKAVGFMPVREFVEDGEPMLLLKLGV